jgi:hypothetical protein
MNDFNKQNKHLEPKQKSDIFKLLCQYIFKYNQNIAIKLKIFGYTMII